MRADIISAKNCKQPLPILLPDKTKNPETWSSLKFQDFIVELQRVELHI